MFCKLLGNSNLCNIVQFAVASTHGQESRGLRLVRVKVGAPGTGTGTFRCNLHTGYGPKLAVGLGEIIPARDSSDKDPGGYMVPIDFEQFVHCAMVSGV